MIVLSSTSVLQFIILDGCMIVAAKLVRATARDKMVNIPVIVGLAQNVTTTTTAYSTEFCGTRGNICGIRSDILC